VPGRWPAPCERLASDMPSTTGMSEMPMAGTLRYIIVSAGAAPRLEGDPEAGAEPDAEADADADAEPEADAEADAEVDAESDSASDTLSGTGSGSSTARSIWSALLSGSALSAVLATGSGVASSAPVG
jgi:S-DNA-T family DNA segregation ATPase FtsK/SpoIIIE